MIEVQPAPEAPHWLCLALCDAGLSERPGKSANPRIVLAFTATSYRSTSDETPWCSAIANLWMAESGVKGTNSARARSWLDWGVPLETPRMGCVVIVKQRKGDPGPEVLKFRGHVCFFLSETKNHIWVIGGNQVGWLRRSGEVSVRPIPKSKLLGYRWPAEVPE